MSDMHQVTRDFEAALCDYTGAKHAVTVTSCTMALLLAVKYWIRGPSRADLITLPRRTYVSVPQSVIHAGGRVKFTDQQWSGAYQLQPTPVWDCARRFTSGMYVPGQYQAVSFHRTKILNDTQGGAILHDDDEADEWFRRMRFDGRTEGVPASEDQIREIGYHCYLSPDVSARLLWKLLTLPRHNDDLPNDDYPDLSQMEAFK